MGRRTNDNRAREIAASAMMYLKREVDEWKSKHEPAVPGTPRRFFKDEIMEMATDDEWEQGIYWRSVRDILDTPKEIGAYHLAFVGTKGRNDPYDNNIGPWIWVNGYDPAHLVSLESFNFKIKKGQARNERKRAITKSQVLGEDAYLIALRDAGISPKTLAITSEAYGFKFPDEIHRKMIGDGKEE